MLALVLVARETLRLLVDFVGLSVLGMRRNVFVFCLCFVIAENTYTDVLSVLFLFWRVQCLRPEGWWELSVNFVELRRHVFGD